MKFRRIFKCNFIAPSICTGVYDGERFLFRTAVGNALLCVVSRICKS